MTVIPCVTGYVNGREGGGAGGNCTRAPATPDTGAGTCGRQGEPLGEPASPLVTTPISEQRAEVYKRSFRVVRPETGNRNAIPPDRSGSVISGFSAKSRSRLRFAAVNAFPVICSQMGLTYHESWPTDGRTAKRHLHAFLVTFRRLCPSGRYLWLLEFQRRNAPHFHLFFTVLPDQELWRKLSAAWVRITSGTDYALWWHGPERGENWIPWVVNNGSYLCKYLDKEAQKSIPDGYINFGRFWGASTDLVSPPEVVPIESLTMYDQIDLSTGEVMQGETYILRNLGRLADRQTRGFSRFRQRAHRGSYTILHGSAAFNQLRDYLGRLKSQREGRCLNHANP